MMSALRSELAGALILLVLLGCSGEAPTVGPADPLPLDEPAASPVAAETVITCLGDSLTAGYGIDDRQAWPQVLEGLLRERGHAVRVVNAGVSGDTTAGGLRRLEWVLRTGPDLAVVCLGGNDGLRGLDPALTEANLRRIVEGLRERGVTVLLAGMRLPSNWGAEHTDAFAALYPRLAEQLDVAFLPFLLEGVALQRELNQSDGIHPEPAGHALIAARVATALEPLLRAATADAP